MVAVKHPAVPLLDDWLRVAAAVEEASFVGRRVVLHCAWWCSLDSVVLVAEEAHAERWSVNFVGYRCQVDAGTSLFLGISIRICRLRLHKEWPDLYGCCAVMLESSFVVHMT